MGCISVYKRQGDLGPYSVLVDTIQFLPVDAFDSQCWRLTVAQRYSQQICIHNTTHIQRDSGAAKRDLWELGLVILGLA